MRPTIVTDLSLDSLLIHWLVLEKECPLDVVRLETPALADPPYYQAGEILIYDPATLVQFLQERYPGEQLLPSDPVSRAQIRQACTLISEPDVDIFSEVEEILDTGSDYLAGREFTLLDIYVGVWLSENYTLDNSSVRSYWERISSRPAFIKASQ
jgi:glutathione S-transferase